MTTTTREDIVRAALYARVSTTDQSLIRQHVANLAACERAGWAPVEYDDPGLSASRFAGRNGGASRKDWGRLLADLAAGRIGVLVLWEASRGDRQLASWSALLDTCRKHGVLIHVTSENYTYDVTRARDWKALAEAGIASAMESETLSLRIKSGKDSGVTAGRPQGGVAYGVHRVRDPEKTKWAFIRDEPDDEVRDGHPCSSADVVRRIVREAGKGIGWQQIADGLNADGIPAARAAQWDPRSVRVIAGNEVYTTTTPPVVTVAEHLAARARLARKGERAARQTFRYSAALSCGKCGNLVRGGQRAGQGRRYTCPQGCVSIAAPDADDFIDALAVERLTDPGLIGLSRQPDDGAAAAHWAEAARLRAKITAATASYNADRLDLATLEEITAANKPKIEAAEKRARDAEMPPALAGLPDADRAVVATRWASLTIPARKAALRRLAPDAIILPAGRGNAAPVDERVKLWPDGPDSQTATA
jgi:site-specific DNA recombinase